MLSIFSNKFPIPFRRVAAMVGIQLAYIEVSCEDELLGGTRAQKAFGAARKWASILCTLR